MDELIAFLNARLDIEERRARAVKPLGFTHHTGGGRLDEMFAVSRLVPAPEDGAYFRQRDGDAEVHFLCHDPERVLADVAAKRKILQEVWNGLADFAANITEIRGDDCGALEYRAGLVKLFALPYADHPDYREEWRP